MSTKRKAAGDVSATSDKRQRTEKDGKCIGCEETLPVASARRMGGHVWADGQESTYVLCPACEEIRANATDLWQVVVKLPRDPRVSANWTPAEIATAALSSLTTAVTVTGQHRTAKHRVLACEGHFKKTDLHQAFQKLPDEIRQKGHFQCGPSTAVSLRCVDFIPHPTQHFATLSIAYDFHLRI